MTASSGRTHWAALILLLSACSATAQQALQNMLAGDNSAAIRGQQMQGAQSQDYTLKAGDFQMMVVPAMGLQYNDNVNLAQSNVLADFIVSPSVGITASYPLSQRNLLYLDISLGYNWYLEHPQFSSFALSSASGTGLSFDFAIKDFTVNLHDRMSYSEGAGQFGSGSGGFVANSANGSVANTATYGTFENIAGLLGTWDLNKVKLSVGYDHENNLSTSSQYDEDSYSAEMVTARLAALVHPKVNTGLEATAAFTTYEQSVLNNNDAYTIGPFIEFRPDKFFTVSIRGGYSIYEFQNSSAVISTASQNGWYADLKIEHQASDSVTYTLDAGREVQLGTVSDLLEDWYIRPNITLKIIKGLTFNTFLFYEHGDQGVGSTVSVPSSSAPGTSTGTFNWYGGGLSLQHPITLHLALALNYQLTLHSSDIPNESYTQNLVALQLTYNL